MSAAVQPDLFTGPPPARTPQRIGEEEQRLRDRVLERHEELRAEYLIKIRLEMTFLFAQRQRAIREHGAWLSAGRRETEAWVSADDARAFFETLSPPADLSRNFLGQVFRQGGWVALPGRRILSQTAGSHRNELKCWTIPLITPGAPE